MTNKKILVAPNSFKECASSVEAAELFVKYLSSFNIDITAAPLSDGGDGFLRVCSYNFKLEELKFAAQSPLHIPLEVPIGYNRKEGIVYLESADIVGLKLIPEDKRAPLGYTSAGMGELLNKIYTTLPVKKFVIGIGGTATNDLGLGMLIELGLRLYNRAGDIIAPVPSAFNEISGFEFNPVFNLPIGIVTDVDNPLVGVNGASSTYGPQKGLKENEINFIDGEFDRLSALFCKGRNIENSQLSGAGGGLAAGIQIFLNAVIRTSGDFILEDLGLKNMLPVTDYVITGEGSFDNQSMHGKGAGIIIKNSGRPVFLVCGKIDSKVKLPDHVIPVELHKYFGSSAESIKNIKKGIEKASSEILDQI